MAAAEHPVHDDRNPQFLQRDDRRNEPATVNLVRGRRRLLLTSLSRMGDRGPCPEGHFIAANAMNSAISGLDTAALTGALYPAAMSISTSSSVLLLDNRGGAHQPAADRDRRDTAFIAKSACAPRPANAFHRIGGTAEMCCTRPDDMPFLRTPPGRDAAADAWPWRR